MAKVYTFKMNVPKKFEASENSLSRRIERVQNLKKIHSFTFECLKIRKIIFKSKLKIVNWQQLHKDDYSPRNSPKFLFPCLKMQVERSSIGWLLHNIEITSLKSLFSLDANLL